MYLLDAIAIENEITITRLFLLLKYAVHIIAVIIPIILIIKCTMDMYKSVVSTKELPNSLKQIGYRIACAVTIFFVPTFANAIFGMVEEYNPNAFTEIYQNASLEQIESLEVDYDNAIKSEKALRIAQKKELAKKQKEEERKKIEQKEEQRRQEQQNNSGSYDSSGEANGTYGSVTYANGVFTIPNRRATSDADIPKQSGSYGLNPVFSDRLNKFIADAKKEGYTITVTSGWRSYSSQASLWYNSNRACSERGKWVACPGGSRHGFGIAADLSFNGTGCSGGWNCNAAAKWAHENAPNYGLRFPMSWEAWHIEPTNVKGGAFGACQAKC